MVAWIASFAGTYHALTTRWPVIYTTSGWWAACTGSYGGFAGQDPLWIARYSATPGTLPGGWGTYTFWQYAPGSTLAGDQDIFNGTSAGLAAEPWIRNGSRRAVPAHRRAVRRAGPQRHRLGSDREPLSGHDAGGAVDPGRQVSSATLLRRLWTYSRHNNFCKAFREVGRVTGTVQLLRFLSGPQLRRRTTAETGKVESCNRFPDWRRFGNHGVIAANDPGEQEKLLKFSTLLTNAVIFHTILGMMAAVRGLIADGWSITLKDLAVLSPYLAARIQRFGVYATDEITLTPDAYDAHLGVDLAEAD